MAIHNCNLINRLLRLFPYVKQLEEDKLKALTGELSLVDLHIKDGQLDATFKTKIAELLCVWCIETIGDAPNYVECQLTVNDPPHERYTVTVKRCNGKTAHELRQIAEQKLAELKAIMAQQAQLKEIINN